MSVIMTYQRHNEGEVPGMPGVHCWQEFAHRVEYGKDNVGFTVSELDIPCDACGSTECMVLWTEYVSSDSTGAGLCEQCITALFAHAQACLAN